MDSQQKTESRGMMAVGGEEGRKSQKLELNSFSFPSHRHHDSTSATLPRFISVTQRRCIHSLYFCERAISKDSRSWQGGGKEEGEGRGLAVSSARGKEEELYGRLEVSQAAALGTASTRGLRQVLSTEGSGRKSFLGA